MNDVYLERKKSTAFPTFHSFTGCDTVSAYCGKGKLSAWTAWKCYPAVTEALRFIAENPFVAMEMNSYRFKLLGRFTAVLYDKTSQLASVDEAHRELFCHRDKMMMDALPSPQGVLLQHSNRAVSSTISRVMGLDSGQGQQGLAPLLDDTANGI